MSQSNGTIGEAPRHGVGTAWIAARWDHLLNVGVPEHQGAYLKTKVRLCNQIAVFLFALGLVYVIVSLVYFPGAAFMPGGASVVAILAIALNAHGHHRIARFGMAIGAVTLDSVYHAYLVPAGEPVILPLYLAAASFSLYAWVLIDIREKWLLTSSVTINCGWLVGQNAACAIIEADVDNSPFRSGWLTPVTYAFAILVAAYCLWVLQKRNIITEGERDTAMAQLDARYREECSSREAAELKGSLLEHQLQQAHKLEAIGRLAGGVAHDLNNLLTPVIGYGELLRDELGEQDELRSFTDGILEAGTRARELVGQLLAFGRKQMLELRSTSINELVRTFYSLLRRTIREDVRIDLILGEHLPKVLVDPRRIEQVLMNLCVNAQDAMANGGVITIETKVIEFAVEQSESAGELAPGLYVVVVISDQGLGISSDDLSKIFEPFYSTKGAQGTGLGLATVFGITKQHGGSITVRSDLGQGATFSVYLPACHQLQESRECIRQMTPMRPTSGSTILLVEDHANVRGAVEIMLTRLGYRVLAAHDADAALEVLRRYAPPIDLILTDVVMPKMNGTALIDAATRLRPSIKVLFMSGYSAEVTGRQRPPTQGFRVLQKPFTTVDLANSVEEALKGA